MMNAGSSREGGSSRAPRMSAQDRRSHILDAAMPLILERGAEVTTRELAEAAGVAEGTIFRAFEDKQALIDAAVHRVMDPAALLVELEEDSAHLSLEDTVARIVRILHGHVRTVVAFMTALGPRDHARHHGKQDGKEMLGEVTDVIESMLAPHADALRVEPATAVDYLRVLVFGTSMPFIRSAREITADELTDFILRGISREGD